MKLSVLLITISSILPIDDAGWCWTEANVEFIQEYQDWMITNVYIGRMPVDDFRIWFMECILDAMIQRVKDEEEYSDMWHAFIVIKIKQSLSSNETKLVRFEKDGVIIMELIEQHEFHQMKEKDEFYEEDIRIQNIKVSTMIGKLLEHNAEISVYDAIKSNCQCFVTRILQALGIELTAKLHDFYIQDWSRAFEQSDVETIREIGEIHARYFCLGSMHEEEFKMKMKKLKIIDHPPLDGDVIGEELSLTWGRKLRLFKLK